MLLFVHEEISLVIFLKLICRTVEKRRGDRSICVDMMKGKSNKLTAFTADYRLTGLALVS